MIRVKQRLRIRPNVSHCGFSGLGLLCRYFIYRESNILDFFNCIFTGILNVSQSHMDCNPHAATWGRDSAHGLWCVMRKAIPQLAQPEGREEYIFHSTFCFSQKPLFNEKLLYPFFFFIFLTTYLPRVGRFSQSYSNTGPCNFTNTLKILIYIHKIFSLKDINGKTKKNTIYYLHYFLDIKITDTIKRAAT